MAAESGHAASRTYRDQAGDLHLNGGKIWDANEKDVSNVVSGQAAGYKIARGVTTTATASDTVATGLTTVIAAVASLEDAPGLDPGLCQAVVGDQAGTPAAGSILIKTYKFTSTANPTPIAATTFTKKVSWVAIGT